MVGHAMADGEMSLRERMRHESVRDQHCGLCATFCVSQGYGIRCRMLRVFTPIR